jgi:signal transduction histidine kinase
MAQANFWLTDRIRGIGTRISGVSGARERVTPAEAPAGTLKGELLYMFASQGGTLVVVSQIAALSLIAFVAKQHINPLWPLMWLALVSLVVVLRSWVLTLLPTDDEGLQEGRMRIVLLFALLASGLHAMSLVFFPYLSDVERIVPTLVLISLATGAVFANVGYMPIAAVFPVMTLVPLSAMWAINPGTASVGWLEPALALLVLLYGAVLFVMARQLFRVFSQSFAIRQQQADLNARLRTALGEAESASRAKTRFLASASHDLRQPIHTLSLFSAALSMRPMDERTREIAGHLEIALKHLANQLDALLDVSKLDAGVIEQDLGRVPLRPLIERLVAEYRPICADKGLALVLRCEDDTAVCTDAMLLERILRNLLGNAIKYTDTGEVRIELAEAPPGALIVIEDTGRGIPGDEQVNVFEEFYQLDNPERDRVKGLGLGLAIVRRLTELLEIDIRLESKPGKGTRFELSVPNLGAEPAVDAIDPDVGSELEAVDGGARVLVVEDEAEVRAGMKALLEVMGFSVQLADSTEQALALARIRPPQILLADLRLRGDDSGFRAIRALRRLLPGLPALIISGDTAPSRLREAQDAGLELLHKPVAADVLQRAILRALEPG